jgi:hypothetical protein
MSQIPQPNIQGSIFELVARGKKDTYFAVDRDTSVHVFNSDYNASTPHLEERRTIVPLNAPKFGQTCEIELDKYGDVLTQCTILIDLPTWLPPLPVVFGGTTLPPQDANQTYWIKDLSGVSYGYCAYIGYFLFERIQLYQDSALLQEWSGDLLFALSATEGSWNSAYLDSQYLGGVDTSPYPGRNIAGRATPSRLRLSLPIPGAQTPGDGGFPVCCLPNQSYRVRMKLRNLEDLVVSDDPTLMKPKPWLASGFTYDLPSISGPQPYTFQPVPQNAIGQPTILLETVQSYVSPETKRALQESKQSIPFRRPFENIFTFGEADYAPLDVSGIAASTRRLDARHPVERVVFFFRTQQALDRNNYIDVYDPASPDTQFYNGIKLIIAGQDREFLYGSQVWQDIMAYAKDENDSGYNIGEFRWNLGDLYSEIRPFSRVPNGAVNFTSADRPTLYVQLNNVPYLPSSGTSSQRKTELRVFMEGWNVYEIERGRGRLLFAN